MSFVKASDDNYARATVFINSLKSGNSKTRAWIWKLIGALLICLFVAIYFATRNDEPPPVFSLSPSPKERPRTFRDQVDRVLLKAGKKAALLWRVEETMFGKPMPVNISSEVFSAPPSLVDNIRESGLVGARVETNGIVAWEFEGKDHAAIAKFVEGATNVEVLSRPRIMIGDGTEGSVFIGSSVTLNSKPTEVGLLMSALVRNHQASREVFLSTSHSEFWSNSIRTNFELSARMILRKGHGVFMAPAKAAGTNQSIFGVIFEPKD